MRIPIRQVGDFIPGRTCGTCQACCEVLGVKEFAKPNYRRCDHQCGAGCGIYADRPQSCRDYSCLWLQGQIDGDERRRPDKLGLVFNGTTDGVIQVWEVWPGASEAGAAKFLLDKLTDRGPVIICTETARKLRGPLAAVALIARLGIEDIW